MGTGQSVTRLVIALKEHKIITYTVFPWERRKENVFYCKSSDKYALIYI